MPTANDDFNRADAGDLGANWTEFSEGFKIVSNQAVAVNSGVQNRAYYSGAGAFGNDQYSSVVVGTGSGSNGGYDARVGVRLSGTGTTISGYELRWGDIDGTSVKIFRVDSGSETQLQSTTLTVAPGDVMRIEVEGTTIRAFKNGVQIGTDQTDANHASGEVGIHGRFDGYDVFNSWEGGDFSGGDTTPPTASGWATNTAGTEITATLSESGCTPASGTGGFSLSGTAATVASWAISGTTLTLTLSGTIYNTETVTLDYDDATASEAIADAADNLLADISDAAVTNNSTVDPPSPSGGSMFRSAVISRGRML